MLDKVKTITKPYYISHQNPLNGSHPWAQSKPSELCSIQTNVGPLWLMMFKHDHH